MERWDVLKIQLLVFIITVRLSRFLVIRHESRLTYFLSLDIAAQQDHREACFALTAWYLVGSPGVLPQSDTEAYLWARKAADMGLAKAEYAVGYFTEVKSLKFAIVHIQS